MIGFVKIADHHAFLGAAGVSKSAIANIDADMVDFSPEVFLGIEKDQVSISKLTQRDSFSAFGLVDRSSGQPEVHRGIAVIGKPGTVKTIGSLTCVAVSVAIRSAKRFLEGCTRRGLVFYDWLIPLFGSTGR